MQPPEQPRDADERTTFLADFARLEQIIASLPDMPTTVGDLFRMLDERAHALENDGAWIDAAAIRLQQADVLVFFDDCEERGIIDMGKALMATRNRLLREELHDGG